MAAPRSTSNGRTVAVLLLAIALLPLIALVVTFPQEAGPPVAVFLLTGLITLVLRRRRG